MNSIDTKFFIIIETVLYLSFLLLDISGFYLLSGYIKFISIALVFLFILIKSIAISTDFFIPMALACSVFADFFLLFSNQYITGICAFLLVQILLFLQIHHLFEISFKYQILLPICFLFIELIIIINNEFLWDYIIILAISYFLLFLSNIITLVFIWYRGKIHTCKRRLFSIGCFLFFLCDIHVGLYNISEYNTIMGNLLDANWFYLGMWLFYLPGQIMIACSNISRV